MAQPLYKIIDFPTSDTKNGVLTMFQHDKKKSDHVPFTIRKVLATTGMNGKDARGAHTHHKTHLILICLSGGCVVDLDNTKEKATITLNNQHQGLYLYPYVWHVMHSFKPTTVLLVLADRKYDEREYIRDYNEFLKFAAKKNKSKTKKKK